MREVPARDRPPALMVALHIWAMAHGIASLFGRGDAARRALPMSPEELLEADVLIYLRGLGIADRTDAAKSWAGLQPRKYSSVNLARVAHGLRRRAAEVPSRLAHAFTKARAT